MEMGSGNRPRTSSSTSSPADTRPPPNHAPKSEPLVARARRGRPRRSDAAKANLSTREPKP
eukprot:4772022-Prymnesium_polylepis.2